MGIDYKTIKPLDKEVNTSTKYIDRAYLIDNKYIINIEVQTRHVENIKFRMLFYNVMLHDIYSLPVQSVLVYLTPDKKEKIENIYKSSFMDTKTDFNFKVIKLWEYDYKDILDTDLYGLYPLVPLMKRDINLVRECSKRILDLELSNSTKSNLISTLRILSGLFYSEKDIEKMLSYEKVKDSSTVKKLILEDHKALLINFIKEKFKDISNELKNKIISCNDIEKIDKALKSVLTSKTESDILKDL